MPVNNQTSSGSKTLLWTGRVLSALPVLLLIFFGAFGLLKPAMVAPQFTKYGYPPGALSPILVTEIAVALLYAFPATSVLGAILISAYLGGAVSTHVRAGEPFFLPIVVAVVAWLGLYLRDRRLRDLVPLYHGEK
jgi:hypothetical protein